MCVTVCVVGSWCTEWCRGYKCGGQCLCLCGLLDKETLIQGREGGQGMGAMCSQSLIHKPQSKPSSIMAGCQLTDSNNKKKKQPTQDRTYAKCTRGREREANITITKQRKKHLSEHSKTKNPTTLEV